MKNLLSALLFAILISQPTFSQETTQDLWPHGTPISDWFHDYSKVKLEDLGKQFLLTDFGVKNDSSLLQTQQIQGVIDQAAKNGGGVIIIPKGTFLSGALFFKPKTHLYLAEGAVLKGSDDISNYPLLPSRMEGQNLDYFAALVNAYGVDGFTISGHGTINGKGLKFWEAFWQRRKEDPNCTNLEVSRPRLIISFQRVAVVGSFISKKISKIIQHGLISSNQSIPKVVTNFMSEMTNQCAIWFRKLLSHLLTMNRISF
ncbi:hypothetical protein [Algoriphagus aquimarinus]|uniref:hypothetical protein n=1 Tax=Algoriphagus aquimarinus TaxID=237018 RepID=UPI0030D72624